METARQRGRRTEGGEHSSHAWNSGLVEWCLQQELLGAISHASDDPFTNFVPFIRVCVRRVRERDLVIEEIILSESQVAVGGASYGQSELIFNAPKTKKKEQ